LIHRALNNRGCQAIYQARPNHFFEVHPCGKQKSGRRSGRPNVLKDKRNYLWLFLLLFEPLRFAEPLLRSPPCMVRFQSVLVLRPLSFGMILPFMSASITFGDETKNA
jgi:hypothetical protein